VDSRRRIVWYKYTEVSNEISAAYIRVDEAGYSTISIHFLHSTRRHIPVSNFVVVALRTVCLPYLLIRLECIYLPNTVLFDGRYISSIYYISYSYMFRHLPMAIFRLYMKCLGTQWLRCCATNRKVAGSIPAGVSGFFIDIKFFRSHYDPGVDSASNRNEYQEHLLGVKAAGA